MNHACPQPDGYQIPDAGVDADGKIDFKKREEALTARYEDEVEVQTEQVNHGR